MGTGDPRQIGLETAEEVENRPGKNHDVVDVQVNNNNLRCDANPCEYHKFKNKIRQA